MNVTFLKRNFIQRMFGIPATPKPKDPSCWQYNDGLIRIDLAKATELDQPFGAIRLEGGSLPKRILVMADETGEIRAFHNRCSHLGHRRLDPVPGTSTVQCCSVNKSTYDYQGQKVFGPAPHDIRWYAVIREGNTLSIDISA